MRLTFRVSKDMYLAVHEYIGFAWASPECHRLPWSYLPFFLPGPRVRL